MKSRLESIVRNATYTRVQIHGVSAISNFYPAPIPAGEKRRNIYARGSPRRDRFDYRDRVIVGRVHFTHVFGHIKSRADGIPIDARAVSAYRLKSSSSSLAFPLFDHLDTLDMSISIDAVCRYECHSPRF